MAVLLMCIFYPASAIILSKKGCSYAVSMFGGLFIGLCIVILLSLIFHFKTFLA
jgi:hypothetical protein